MELGEEYKKTEVGIIPQDWNAIQVDDLISEISMGPFGSDVKVSNFVSEGVPFLSGDNIRTNKLKDGFNNFVTHKKAKELKKAVASRGDIVVTHRGTIGQIAYIPESSEYRKYVISQSQFRARFKSDVNPNWIALYFLSNKGSSSLLEGKGHTGVPAITQATTTFRKLYVPMPPKSEQDKICLAIDDVDALITQLENLITKKRQIKQGAMQTLLNPFDKNGSIKDGWKEQRLGDTASLKARIGWQGLTTSEYLKTGDYFLITGTEFKNGFIDWDSCHYVEQERYKQDRNIQIKPNDILVTKDGTIGKVAFVRSTPKPATLNSGVFVIRPLNESFHPEFFYYVLMSDVFTQFLIQLCAGSTINHLYQKDFVHFKFYTPNSLEEQKEIAQVFSDMDEEIHLLNKKLEKTRSLKEGMMQSLLTGQIRLVDPTPKNEQ